MPASTTTDSFDFIGTGADDIMVDGFWNLQGQTLQADSAAPVSANGREGNDRITTGAGNDLAAGDMVGAEWTLVDGEWTYDSAAVVLSDYGFDSAFNDVITTGAGNDVLLGNGGNDMLAAGAGNDTINAGRGDDRVFAGTGNDIVNLEQGHDTVEAGLGADIVNGGAGNDVIYGDLEGENLLDNGSAQAPTFGALAAGGWHMTDDQGSAQITQSAATIAGETYTISFDLAANLAAGMSAACVDVIWNGEVIDTVEVASGAFETFSVDVVSTGAQGALGFRTAEVSGATAYDFDGPIISYEKTVTLGGEELRVDAFAAGQSNLYQVIDGQLHVFDVEAQEYTRVGDAPSFKINAVGFNIEDDLIYGVAKSNGTDTLGNQVSATDIVMIDAHGDTYRVGEGFYGDYVGDFDNAGNLWTFHSALDRISLVDVDRRDADGSPHIDHFKFPGDMFTDRTFDTAYDASQNSFLAVVAPDQNGGSGTVVRIDVSAVATGGAPVFSELAITGTLQEGGMQDGMPRGAYGAVFFDGEGNLYFGLNNGDHDLDPSTATQGGIFRVDMDWSAGTAYAEFMAEAPRTGSNDGAVDPRGADAFGEVDADAPVLLRDPALTLVEGGNDTLRGGAGDDEIHGNAGDDEINGGAGHDMLAGDQGHDNISGAAGDDLLLGGAGNDSLRGQAGEDTLDGALGDDYLAGGAGDDVLDGGAGSDRLVGGAGADHLAGGAGDDQLWGGNWGADGTADTFVFAQGGGRDFVHDFETAHDQLDLSAFGTDLSGVLDAAQDQGWATLVDLSRLQGGEAGDRIVLLTVDLAELDSGNFIF